jgi:hypothetical protein
MRGWTKGERWGWIENEKGRGNERKLDRRGRKRACEGR